MTEPPLLHSPAFRLLLACADWPRSDSSRQKITNAMEELAGDWPTFIGLVDRHRMAPLALDGFMSAGVEPAEALSRRASRDKRRALTLALEGRRLAEVMNAAGIETMLLKGPLLAQRIYGDPGMRQCADLDLLVPEERLEEARYLLGDDGYQLLGPEPPWGDPRMHYWRKGAKDLTLRNPERKSLVELHFRLRIAEGLLPGLGIADARGTAELAGTPMRVFEDADLFAYLAVHGATSLWHRLKWLADIRAVLAGKSEAELLILLDHARGLGVERCAALAMLLCERLWGLELPRNLHQIRDRDRSLRLLVQRSLEMLCDPDASMQSFGRWKLAGSSLRLRDDWRYRRSYLAMLLFHPRAVMESGISGPFGSMLVLTRIGRWVRSRLSGV